MQAYLLPNPGPAAKLSQALRRTGGEANPRFVVTSLTREEHEARHLYEQVYCDRGEMENRIKLAMPTAFPYQAEYNAAHAALTAAATA